MVAPAGFAPTPSGLEPDLLLLQITGHLEIITFNYTKTTSTPRLEVDAALENGTDLSDRIHFSPACAGVECAEVYDDELNRQTKFQNDVPDFIYIDANHTYEGCKSDIQTALLWNGLKLIGGHDYAGWCPGVIQAVDEIFGKPTKTFADSSWVKVI